MRIAILGVAALLGACASFPGGSPSRGPGSASAPSGPVSPSIPDPVAVTVKPIGAPSEAADRELVSRFDAPPDLAFDDVPAVTRDLFDRLRAGLAIDGVRNARIDREADWFANNPEFIERTFTRAAPYLHYIVSEVEARGLPLEIALLPVIESAFEPYAYSRARAMGLWQFMPVTGSRFSLKQDWWYDGRRDVVAATQAALDYLQYLHQMFDGDWLLAIGAYNCGEGNVSKAIRRNRAAKKSIDFFNLRLPAETRGYVPRLLAMARIVAEPEKYGLVIEGIPDLPYFKRVETGGQINIAVAAELSGIETEEMYALNPAHHRWATDPTGPHSLLVPAESADAFQQGLLLLTPDQRMRVERYSVREGDTVASIATRFGSNTEHLRELNGLGTANTVAVGSELRVPSSVTQLPEKVLQAAARFDSRSRAGAGGVRAVHVVRRGETLSTIAKRHGMGLAQLARINGINQNGILRAGQRLRLSASTSSSSTARAAAVIEPSGSGNRVTYVVRRGDTLTQIARTLRVSVANLRSWNEITNDALLRPGQRLVAFVRGGS